MDSFLIPVRNLNQFVFCPRLAYLQWVQSEWADNEFTVEGTWVHRRVDAREGWIPDPDQEADFRRQARSVTLSAPVEGLVAKLDLIDASAAEAVPVEYKRGSPPPQLSDLVQLTAQSLVQREKGWKV